ncbi:sigma-54-dependent Fis family transcriptional regulator [bacterium]|nr:sigma-54-dependent Fis family transcriptional regulator [candidate division CSSED10-310 bacterium]
MVKRILVIDDHKTMRDAVCEVLRRQGYEVICAAGGGDGLDILATETMDLVITDLKMPGVDGMAVLERARREHPDLPVMLITAYGTVDNAVEAMRLGAVDYITKPFSHAELELRVGRALSVSELRAENRQLMTEKRFLLEELQDNHRFGTMIGESEPMQRLFAMLPKIAASRASVLILGESGTGKELIARAIHYNGPRRDKPFIRVDCGYLPEGILESELFGHERGAFTGAVKKRLGRFELAHHGTLFLDEIGNISPTVQMKLLRVLQEGEFQRVGGERTISVDVRIIAATNADLEAKVCERSFREDLLYRLNVISLLVPPLRDRRSDIPALAGHFLEEFNRELKRHVRGFTPDVLGCFTRHPWPGNIRQLRNWIERAMVLAEGDVIQMGDLPPESLQSDAAVPRLVEGVPPPPLVPTLEKLEHDLIERALAVSGGNKSAAARLLDITVSSLYYKLEKYGFIGGDGSE